MASRFIGDQAPAEALSYGFTRSAYWLRLHLHNSADHPVERMLEIGYPLLSSVQFHQPLADGSYQSLMTGFVMSFATRPYKNRFFVFPVILPAHSHQVFFLRTQSAAATIVPARLWDPQTFHAYERGDYAAQAWYFGMVTAMIFFNLLLFASLRDSIYLLYISFATSMALALSIQNGLAKEFLWPDTTLWSDTSSNFSYLLAVMAFIFFTRSMLETGKKFPKIDLQLKILAGCCLFFLIGATVWTKTFAMPSTSFIFIVSISILGISLFCAFKRQRSAYFFVVAYTTFLLSALMTCLMFLGLIPINTLTIYGMQWASAMEMLLLAFALADRFNMIRRKAIDDVKQVNASLELRLQTREAELTATHSRLREIEQRQILSHERQRLMQDMHDGLGSSLVSALRIVEHGRMDETEVAQVLKGCIDDLKLAIDSIEPVDADLLLLLATLRYRLGPRLESTGIALRWEVISVPKLDWLDPKNALHILRILQEALTNIIKHTHATEIRVATRTESDHVVVTITDNGQGFSVEQALKNCGKGMSNQMRRAEAIGAEVKWDSNDAGTCFTLRLPATRTSGEIN